MAKPDWVIVRSDCTYEQGTMDEWKDTRGWDAQVILFNDPITGWTLRQSGDFYRLDEDGSAVAMDFLSMLQYVVDDLGVVKVGKMLSRDHWDQVYQAAKIIRDKLRTGEL